MNQTIRQISRVSIGGKQVRIEISNEYGKQPVVIGAATVALSDKGAAIKPGSSRALTFGGQPNATIPPGAPIVSDPVALDVPDLASVAVSLFLPEVTPTTTWHNDARQTAYISSPGNVTGETDFKPAQTVTSASSSARSWSTLHRTPGPSFYSETQSPTATGRRWMPTTGGPTFSRSG